MEEPIFDNSHATKNFTMKYNVLLLLAFWASTTLQAQSPGVADSSFAVNGVYLADLSGWESISSAVVQADGKIVVAGYTQTDGQSKFLVARLLPDGSPDPAFGTGGLATAQGSGWINQATAVAIQPDGKIVVGGFTDPDDDFNVDFALLRFTAQGQPDNSFSQDGIATLDITASDIVRSITLLPDGKILAAGSVQIAGTDLDFVVARFLADGALDPGFGSNNGYAITSFGGKGDVPHSMLVQADGKIILVGVTNKASGNADVAMARYTPNGIPDSGFGFNGKVTSSFSSYVDAGLKAILQPDDKILVSGYSDNAFKNSEFALFRYTPDGTVDPSFGSNGIVRSKIGSIYSAAEALMVRPDGKIVAAGCAETATGINLAIKQFKPNGSLDQDFGTNGLISSPISNVPSSVADVLFLADGRMLAAGSCYNPTAGNTDILLLRYLSDLYVGVIETPQSVLAPWIYPNPVSDARVTLKYELPTDAEVVFELLSSNGTKISTLQQGKRTTGEQTEELPLPGDLPNGYYLLNIGTNRGNTVVRILLAR